MAPDLRPFAPLSGSSIDKVSLTNGTLYIDIPLWSVKQRGNLSMNFALTYHSGNSTLSEDCPPQTACVHSYSESVPSVAVTPMFMVTLTLGAYSQFPNGTQTDYGIYWNVNTPDGGQHQMASVGNNEFRSIDATGWLFNQTTSTLTSKDGVHYVFAAITCDNGNTNHAVTCTYEPNLLYIEDANGNRITVTYDSNGYFTGWVDSLGRTIPYPLGEEPIVYGHKSYPAGLSSVSPSSCSGPETANYAQEWKVPGYEGTTAFVLCYASVPIQTYYFHGATPAADNLETTGTASYQLQSVILPDESQYIFQYTPLEPGPKTASGVAINYGQLTQVTLPTAGTIDYAWGTISQYCEVIPNGGYPQTFIERVGTRTLNAGGGAAAAAWTYGLGEEQVGSNSRSITTTETDPLGNTTTHTLTGLQGTCSYYDTQTQYRNSSGTLQRTETTTYSSQPDFEALPADIASASGEYSLAMGVVPTSVTTTWANGATKETTYTYDSGSGFTATDLTGTVTASNLPYGLVTSKIDTDYGSNAAGSTLLTTSTAYTEANSTYLGLNILDHPTNITVTDATTGIQQITDYGYDETALVSGNASAGTSPSTSGWNDSPVDGSYRGNQTSVSRYSSTLGSYLKTNRVFTNTGLISSSTEPSNPSITPAAATSYAYSGTYDGAYLTGITDALGHTAAYVYDEPSGRPTSRTDENSIKTTFGYDSSSRLTSVQRPGGDHNLASTTTYSYPDANHVERTDLLNTSIGPETVTTTYDGLGRESQVHHVDPEGDEYQDTTYDLLGRKFTESTPYRSTSDTNYYGLTTTTYDLFGRPVQIENPDSSVATFQYAGASTLSTNESNGTTSSQKETRTDGLGRLIGVCEIVTSATPSQQGNQTPTACGMEITPTNNSGFLTSYKQSMNGPVTVTQESQTRTLVYNSLGQLTDSTNPEVGHLHFTYDNDGNLTGKQSPVAGDAVGSTETLTTTYSYDALHRVKTKTYAASGSSTIASITPSVTYNYDQTSVAGYTLENPIGRLTSESTTLAGAVQAESIYSYDTAGNIGSHYQCVTTGCSAYKDVEYHRDGDNNVTSFSTPQIAYANTYNQAGHLTGVAPSWTVTANRPASFLSSISGEKQYAPNGEWLDVAYGNGTTETYTYQPRWLTGMTLTDGSTSLYSFSVQHAGDGQLQKSVDSINGTWNYTYDDFNRLLTANQVNQSNVLLSGLGWDYDRYGNRWHQNLTGGGTTASGSVSLAGTEEYVTKTVCVVRNGVRTCTPTTVYDTGTVTVTVGSMTQSVAYGGASTTSTLASAIASAFNSATSSPVTATANGAVVTLVSTADGSAADLSLSASAATSDPTDFPTQSFTTSDSGSMLTGGTGGSGTSTVLTFNLATNRATTSLTYDNAGNVTNDSNHSYVYDAENRVEQVDGSIKYIYDAEGRRVGKSNGTVYVVGLSGQVLDELDNGSWTRSEVYADGHHIATVTPSTVYFTHTDWLGTERARTNMAGQVCESFTSQPFGDNFAKGGTTGVAACDPSPQFFTGKPRDTESNLDDFGARYFSSQWGRWMSPDWSAKPAGVPYSSFSNPQSLNLYGYVGNDPITGEDPDGHLTFGFGDGYNDGDNQNPTVNTNTSTTPASAVAAAANAFGSDMLGGVGRVDQDSPDGKIGAAIGDFGAALLGAGEVAFGTAGEALGTALDATGVGALAGVPINIVSAGVMVEGAGAATMGAVNLMKAGGNFSSGTKQGAKDAAGGKCQSCGVETTPGQKSQKGVTPPGTEGQTDHIQPKSKGGTNDPSNAQHLCRDCNIKKSDKLTNQQ